MRPTFNLALSPSIRFCLCSSRIDQLRHHHLPSLTAKAVVKFWFGIVPLAHDDCGDAGRYAVCAVGRRVGACEPSNCIAPTIYKRPVLVLSLQPKGIAWIQRRDGLMHGVVEGATTCKTKIDIS